MTEEQPRRLGLVADDVTGAGDASVQFARYGWDVFLSLSQEVRLKPDTTSEAPEDAQSVIAVTTDCRALDDDTAHARTRDALNQLIEAGVDRVFLKIDSTMRGSVRGQIAGALEAWRTRYADARAIVCPAYPRMGRTVQANQLLVHGEPVELTAIGRDPVTPVKTSIMSALIPVTPSIALADAATDDDLVALADTIDAAGPSAIAVGSGGLAEALATVWSARSVRLPPSRRRRFGETRRSLGGGGQPDPAFSRSDLSITARAADSNPRMLLLVTSLNPVSRLQVAELREACPDVVLVLPPDDRGESSVVAATMAGEFSTLVERERWDIVGLVGGDGARAALNRLGASGIRIAGSLLEGIPAGVIVGGAADGLAVFTKAGGFGAKDALVRVVQGIRNGSGIRFQIRNNKGL